MPRWQPCWNADNSISFGLLGGLFEELFLSLSVVGVPSIALNKHEFVTLHFQHSLLLVKFLGTKLGLAAVYVVSC